MITSSLQNIKTYTPLSPSLAKAFKYIAETDFDRLPDGQVEIQGDDVYAIIQRYDTKPLEQGKWEAHQKYIDLQYIAKGQERIGFGLTKQMTITQPYCGDLDYMLLDGQGQWVTLLAGQWMVLFPEDAHMPCIACDEPTLVTKVVVKIKVDACNGVGA